MTGVPTPCTPGNAWGPDWLRDEGAGPAPVGLRVGREGKGRGPGSQWGNLEPDIELWGTDGKCCLSVCNSSFRYMMKYIYIYITAGHILFHFFMIGICVCGVWVHTEQCLMLISVNPDDWIRSPNNRGHVSLVCHAWLGALSFVSDGNWHKGFFNRHPKQAFKK
jgi:hypothetical protein